MTDQHDKINGRARKEVGQGPGYETKRISLKVPIGVAIGVVIFIPTALAIIFLFFHFVWKSTPGPKPYAFHRPPTTTPAPRLLAHPKKELHALRVLNKDRLTTYGWVNKKKGVVHIPIKRAMQIIAKHGFPPRPPRPSPSSPGARPQVPMLPTGTPKKMYPTGTANAGGGPP